MLETKYYVNGVEYTDLKEAQKAEKEAQALAEKKKNEAEATKAEVKEIQEAANAYIKLVNDNDEIRASLKASEKEAYSNYKNALNNFSEKHEGYRLRYYNNGETVEFKVEEVKRSSLEEELEEFRNQIKEVFRRL